MTDNEFLAATGIRGFPNNDNCLDASVDLLTAALRIDDIRSEYCERLEARIEAQAKVIEAQAEAIKALRHLPRPEWPTGR